MLSKGESSWFVGVLMGLCAVGWAGNLDPSSPPTAGTMKPLDQVEPRTALVRQFVPNWCGLLDFDSAAGDVLPDRGDIGFFSSCRQDHRLGCDAGFERLSSVFLVDAADDAESGL